MVTDKILPYIGEQILKGHELLSQTEAKCYKLMFLIIDFILTYFFSSFLAFS